MINEEIDFLYARFYLNPYLYIHHDSSSGDYFVKSNQNICLLLPQSAMDILISAGQGESILELCHHIPKYVSPVTVLKLDIEEPIDSFVKVSNLAFLYQLNLAEDVSLFIQLLLGCGMLCLADYTGEKIDKEKLWQKQLKTAHCTALEKWPTRYSDLKYKEADILLIGDKPGTSGVGLLYLASYLYRNNVRSVLYCADTSWNTSEMKVKLYEKLENHHPRFVGISMKWFPHIRRVLTMAKFIKEWDNSIKIILGGDTASYYKQELEKENYIDFIISGDGEQPLLNICRGEKESTSNCSGYCIDKKNLQTDMHLESISEIVVDYENLRFDTIYIPTHRGCRYGCYQCGGNNTIQKSVFKRDETYILRRPVDVQSDIKQLMDYSSVFMFSIDIDKSNINYLHDIFENINLSDHFCAFFSVELISEEMLKYISSVFKYVRFGIDISSFSENHRLKLADARMVKPQPRNREILHILEQCDNLNNCDLDIYTIAGMPLFFQEDILESNLFFDEVCSHRSLHDVQWGKLHAQPGALFILVRRKLQLKYQRKEFY